MFVVSFQGMTAVLLMPDSTNCHLCPRTGVTYLYGLYSAHLERGAIDNRQGKELLPNRKETQVPLRFLLRGYAREQVELKSLFLIFPRNE
jgi:hypothetical protein